MNLKFIINLDIESVLYIKYSYMDIDLCPICGNNHSGSCTTDLIYFVWYPPQNVIVN